MSGSNQLLSLGAWYFLPNLVTGWLQGIYYRLSTRVGDAQPQPGSPRFERHRRNIFSIVIGSYLLYTIYEAHWEIQRNGHFYQNLGLPIRIDERKIQSRFRRLTLQYHPDKLNNPTRDHLTQAQAFYVHLKTAKDTLVDPARRFAYERFGPDILDWKQCTTELDFVYSGLKYMIPYYIVSMLTVIVLGFLRQSEYGRYWQYFTIVAMFALESHIVTRPWHPVILTNFMNPILEWLGHQNSYLPYQFVTLARRISLSVFIAASQIAPRFVIEQTSNDTKENQLAQINTMNRMVQSIDQSLDKLIRLETVPFFDDEASEERLKRQLKAWIVQNEIRNDPQVDAAIRKALEQRLSHDADPERTL